MSSEARDFCGLIGKVTSDGRSALVELEQDMNGKHFAVISPDTTGRIALMNGEGVLSSGMRVCGKAKEGPEAWKALSVEEAE